MLIFSLTYLFQYGIIFSGGNSTVRVTIEISEEVEAALKVRAKAEGRSVEELIQEAVQGLIDGGGNSIDPALVADLHQIIKKRQRPELVLEYPEWIDEEWESDPFHQLADMISEDEVLEGSPTDLAARHDHYLYGITKRSAP